MICLTAIGLTPGGSSTVHIYKQTIHWNNTINKTIHDVFVCVCVCVCVCV